MSDDARFRRTILIIRNGLSQIVEQLNTIIQDLPSNSFQTPIARAYLDLAELEELPWRQGRFVNNKFATKGQHGWIFRQPKNADDKTLLLIDNLSHAIVRAEGKLELGEYLFEFSGTNSQYISRKARKMEA